MIIKNTWPCAQSSNVKNSHDFNCPKDKRLLTYVLTYLFTYFCLAIFRPIRVVI